MPIARYEMPDGRIGRFEVPVETLRVRIHPNFRMVLVVCLEEVSKFGSCLRVFRSENTISHTH